MADMSARRLLATEFDAPGRDMKVFADMWDTHIAVGRFHRCLMLKKSEHVREQTCD
jgi:hypothetical protein